MASTAKMSCNATLQEADLRCFQLAEAEFGGNLNTVVERDGQSTCTFHREASFPRPISLEQYDLTGSLAEAATSWTGWKRIDQKAQRAFKRALLPKIPKFDQTCSAIALAQMNMERDCFILHFFYS